MGAGDSPSTPASTAQNTVTIESHVGPTESPRPVSCTRTPRLTLTPACKNTIHAFISGGGKRASRVQNSVTSPVPPLSITSLKTDVPKKIDRPEDIRQAFFTPLDTTPERTINATETTSERLLKARGRAFEKCSCALENAFFEPENWNKFKILSSCHPRPPVHFFAPRQADKSTPSTRIVVDNVNGFRYHSTEPNVPYPNKDIEDLFYSVGAKGVRCFDGRVVGGVVRYNVSYAVVDFGTIEDAMAAFKAFQGRKPYPDSYHLRLKFADVNDRTFGKRMAVSMGPTERSEEERKAFVEFVEDLDRVDVDLAEVVVPTRPGFTLPARPTIFSEQ